MFGEKMILSKQYWKTWQPNLTNCCVLKNRVEQHIYFNLFYLKKCMW